MFWRRRDEPTAEETDQQPSPPAATTVARPRREPSGMGLRARPGGFGARLRSILGVGAPAGEATWEELEEALIAADTLLKSSRFGAVVSLTAVLLVFPTLDPATPGRSSRRSCAP